MKLLTLATQYTDGVIVAAQCIPTNDILSGPLLPVIRDAAGALGALFYPLVVLVMVVAALGAVATILSKKAPTFIKVLVAAPAILLGLMMLLIIIGGLWTWVSNACPTSPFALV